MRPDSTDSCTESHQKSHHPEPERLDTILRRMGLAPDAEDRLRRLELGLATVADSVARDIQARTDLEHRVAELEASLVQLRSRR